MYKKQIILEGVGMAPSFVPKRKFWIGAAIGALGSIISSEISRINTSDSEKFSREMTREQIAANRENWMMQNAYNSPNSMVQRGTQAGFNAMQALGQTPAGAIAPATPVNARQSNEGASFVNQMFDSVSKFLNQLPLMKSEVQKNVADAKKTEKEAEQIDTQTTLWERLNSINAQSDEYSRNIPLFRNRATGQIGNFAPPEEPSEGASMEDFQEYYKQKELFDSQYENMNPNGYTYQAVINALQNNSDLVDKLQSNNLNFTKRDTERLQNILRQFVTKEQLESDDVLNAFAFMEVYKAQSLLADIAERRVNARKLGREADLVSYLERTEVARQNLMESERQLNNVNKRISDLELEIKQATAEDEKQRIKVALDAAKKQKELLDNQYEYEKFQFEKEYNRSPKGLIENDKQGWGETLMNGVDWLLTTGGHMLNGSVGYHMSNSQFNGNVNSISNSTSNSTVHHVGSETVKNGKGKVKRIITRK